MHRAGSFTATYHLRPDFNAELLSDIGVYLLGLASRADLSATLKEGSNRSGSGFRQNKMRTLLVVSEIALAVILMVGAALLIRTSLALAAVKPGFDSENVLTMRMSLAGQRY